MSHKIFIRSPFNYDKDKASQASSLKCLEPSLTKQEFREDSDINVIARRFGLVGTLPVGGIPAPVYGDFTGIGDYHEALNTVRAAAAAFMQLPASVRDNFDNDPQKLVAFCSDPANQAAAAKLGLTRDFVVPSGPPAVHQSPALVAAAPTASASNS